MDLSKYINSDKLPMEVHDFPWLYESKSLGKAHPNTGKWMLFYSHAALNEAWQLAKKLYADGNLEGVVSMKCSTAQYNPRSSSKNSGVIILYCANSQEEARIMNIGKRIIDAFQYKGSKTIYYKTDEQTQVGTRATCAIINHSYKLSNHLMQQ